VGEVLTPMDRRCADALADEVSVLIRQKVISERSPAADALLDYRNDGQMLSERSDRIASLGREIERLKKLLDRDHTGLAAGLNAVRQIGRGYRWLGLGEWGSYDYTERTEETLRNEIRTCLDEIEAKALLALNESGVRAMAAFYPDRDRIASLEADLAAIRSEREEQNVANATLSALLLESTADLAAARERVEEAERWLGIAALYLLQEGLTRQRIAAFLAARPEAEGKEKPMEPRWECVCGTGNIPAYLDRCDSCKRPRP